MKELKAIALLLIVCFQTNASKKTLSENETFIDQRNKSIIFDFFMNYDLQIRIKESFCMLDLVSSNDLGKFIIEKNQIEFKNTKFELNYFSNKKKTLKRLLLVRSENIDAYTFLYKGHNVNGILFNLAPFTSIEYDDRGNINKITRSSSGKYPKIEFAFEHSADLQKTKIKTYFLSEGKMRLNSWDEYLLWNDKNKIIQKIIYQRSVKDLIYNDKGYVQSFNYDTHTDFEDFDWNYEYDDNDNWIRKYNEKVKISFTRKIK